MRKNATFSERNLNKALPGEKFEQGVQGVWEQVNVEKRVARTMAGGTEIDVGLLRLGISGWPRKLRNFDWDSE